MGSTVRVHSLGIREVKTAPRSPWQNPYVERLIGTLRRECLDQMVVLNETHLRHLRRDYLTYYHLIEPISHWRRTHRSRDRWSAPTTAESSRCPWSEACITGTHGRLRRVVSAHSVDRRR